MNSAARRYLARSLAATRVHPPSTPEAIGQALAYMQGSTTALEAASILDRDESRDWLNRLLVACGIEPPDADLSLRTIYFLLIPGAPEPQRGREIEQHGEFLRRIEGPDTGQPALGGTLMVTGVSLYATGLRLDWSIPLPFALPL